MPARGRSPSGLFLVDKPAGPSSFAVVAQIRRRTGARTGHAGTLDPFATGLLLVLSGDATKLAPSFVGLDKRYLTDVDLRSRTSTGDPEGESIDEHDPPSRAELEQSLEPLRGEIELPVPAASAVKIGGERAYRLHRRGVQVEMPLRRSQVEALDLIAYRDGVATLDLRVGSGTYVRSIADALGGHCASVGFSVTSAGVALPPPFEGEFLVVIQAFVVDLACPSISSLKLCKYLSTRVETAPPKLEVSFRVRHVL